MSNYEKYGSITISPTATAKEEIHGLHQRLQYGSIRMNGEAGTLEINGEIYNVTYEFGGAVSEAKDELAALSVGLTALYDRGSLSIACGDNLEKIIDAITNKIFHVNIYHVQFNGAAVEELTGIGLGGKYTVNMGDPYGGTPKSCNLMIGLLNVSFVE